MPEIGQGGKQDETDGRSCAEGEQWAEAPPHHRCGAAAGFVDFVAAVLSGVGGVLKRNIGSSLA